MIIERKRKKTPCWCSVWDREDDDGNGEIKNHEEDIWGDEPSAGRGGDQRD